jgi:glyceraldehyde 3-phosphate dehydrogenase
MIGINGLGRIGRLLLRRLAASAPERLCALNDPADPETLVHLLRFDSVHGRCALPVSHRRAGATELLRIGKAELPLTAATDPGSIPWTGVHIAVESSGRFTSRAHAARHLRGTTTHTIISAPSPDPDITIIAPVNGDELDLAKHHVISNGSCTAHATAPMLKVLQDAFGLGPSGMSTVHVATNDQRLLDLPHADLRRARAAFQSIIPTKSSAFGALHQVMPTLPKGFSGSALRVPTLSVNLVDVTALLNRPVTVESLNAAYTQAAQGPLSGILGLAHDHAVSRDFTGCSESVLMDLDLTRVLGDRFVKVVGWHDNETGYAARLEDLVLRIASDLESKPHPRHT